MIVNENKCNGFCLIHKPKGLSSFKALYPIKKLYHNSKIGHAGTLDLEASGLLVVGIGNYTRLLDFVQDLPKVYEFDIIFGITTNTYDASGDITEKKDFERLPKEAIESIVKGFSGEIVQKPPIFSALKKDGKKAYIEARKGNDIHLDPRKVFIYSFDIISFELNKIKCQVKCSKGTYVRSLAHEIGQKVALGAVADNIVRTAIGDQTLDSANAYDDESELQNTLTFQQMVPNFPKVEIVKAEDIESISQGRSLFISDESSLKENICYQICNENQELLALGKKTGLYLKPYKVFL